jgi:hypothetical protein
LGYELGEDDEHGNQGLLSRFVKYNGEKFECGRIAAGCDPEKFVVAATVETPSNTGV